MDTQTNDQQAYHSKIDVSKSIGNTAYLTFKTKCRGPIQSLLKSDVAGKSEETTGSSDVDIIEEALAYFKANVFFKTYEIQSDSDRVLIYVTLYITECLKKLQRCTSREQGLQEMYSLAISRFDIPGDPGFPLNSVYSRPGTPEEADLLRQYLLQLRQETGQRIVERVFDKDSGKPSKWWLCFAKRKFMDISLSGPGQ